MIIDLTKKCFIFFCLDSKQNDMHRGGNNMHSVRKKILIVLLAFLAIMPICAGGTSEKTQADAETVAESAVSKRPQGTISLGTMQFGGAVRTTRPSVSGTQIVGSGQTQSTMAGYNILLQGGTAFDAAVAIAAVQGLVEPCMTNIFGGDAEIMIYSAKDQKAYVYNGTGWAPEKATLDFYMEQGGIPHTGALSVQVPGEWAGWMKLLEDYGTMPLKDILEPVIDVAESTFVDPGFAGFIKMAPTVSKGANQALEDLYTKEDGTRYQVGDVWSNPDLVEILKNIVKVSEQAGTIQQGYTKANDYYYRGPIAEKIVAWSNANGGLFTLEDFSEFYAEIQEPWSTDFRGYEVLVCPPNSQGPLLLEALNILENFDLESFERNSTEYIDLIVQTLNLAMVDRNMNFGDPRFIDCNKDVISKEYAKERAGEIHLGTPMEDIPVGMYWQDFEEKGGDTTFFYVADKYGNVVACTHSICNIYAAKVVVDGTGIILNNRMTYFDLDEAMPNHLEPRKRTMQTITPTIGLKNGRPAFLVGTPGADLQEQAKLQTLLNAIVYGMTDPQLAIEGTRFQTTHPAGLMYKDQYPKTITLEPGDISDETIMALEEMGYKIKWDTDRCIGFAWITEDGYKWGGEDPRYTGYAVAW